MLAKSKINNLIKTNCEYNYKIKLLQKLIEEKNDKFSIKELKLMKKTYNNLIKINNFLIAFIKSHYKDRNIEKNYNVKEMILDLEIMSIGKNLE